MVSLTEKRNSKVEFWIFFGVLTLLSLFMILWCGPLSEYPGHDYYFHFRRFDVLIEAIRNGNFPVHIDYQTLHGYGYFTQAFYPELTMVPFALVGVFTGASFAYSLMIFSFTFLCGLFTYYAVNAVFKNSFAAAVSGIAYAFSTYHLYDWYNRAALGEALSFTFIPLIFLGLYHVIAGDYKKWYILTIGYSLLIYTHLLSSVLTFIAIVILLLLCSKSLIKEPKRILYLMLAAAVTLPLIASYLLPMLEQMASNTFYYSINENITGIKKHKPDEIFWGMLSGIAYKGDTWDMRNLCGTGPLPIILISLRLFVREKTSYRKIADICVIAGFILLFMVSSFFPWGRLPLAFVQFPWRLYEFIVFFFVVAGGYYISVILRDNWQRILATLGIVILTIVTMVINDRSYKYILDLSRDTAPEWYDGVPTKDNDFYLGMYEYLPVKVPSLRYIEERRDSVKVLNLETEVTDFRKDNGVISFNVKTGTLEKVELPFVYYKGYKAVNCLNEEFIVEESDLGLAQIVIDKSTDVKIYYGGTLIQRIGWIITIISTIALCVYIFFYRKGRSL